MFNIIGMIVSGLIVGVLARFFYPGAVGMGWAAPKRIVLATSRVVINGFTLLRPFGNKAL